MRDANEHGAPFVTSCSSSLAPSDPNTNTDTITTAPDVTNADPYISATVREVRDAVGTDEPDEEGEGNDVVSSDVSFHILIVSACDYCFSASYANCSSASCAHFFILAFARL